MQILYSKKFTHVTYVRYLSNIRALKGLLAESRGGGILSTIAFKISVIPTPSYKRKAINEILNRALIFTMLY